MSICHFGPISAFRVYACANYTCFLLSVFELPGIYLASPQIDYTEERVLILKLKKQWCNISFPSSDLI